MLPYAEAALLAEVHKTGTIVTEEYVDDGTRVVAFAPRSLRGRLRKACKEAGTPFAADEEEERGGGGARPKQRGAKQPLQR